MNPEKLYFVTTELLFAGDRSTNLDTGDLFGLIFRDRFPINHEKNKHIFGICPFYRTHIPIGQDTLSFNYFHDL